MELAHDHAVTGVFVAASKVPAIVERVQLYVDDVALSSTLLGYGEAPSGHADAWNVMLIKPDPKWPGFERL